MIHLAAGLYLTFNFGTLASIFLSNLLVIKPSFNNFVYNMQMVYHKKRYHFSIKKKLIIIYLLISILPISLIIFVETELFISSMERNIADTIRLSLNQNKKKLDEQIDKINTLIFTMATDQEILEISKEYKHNNYSPLLGKRIANIFVEYGHLNKKMIRAIALLNPTNEIKGYDFYSESVLYESSLLTDKSLSGKFQRLKESKTINDHPISLFISSSPTDVISQVCELAFPVRNLLTKEVLSILSLYIKTDFLFDIITLPNDTDNRIKINEYIIDGKGNLIAGPDGAQEKLDVYYPSIQSKTLTEKGFFDTSQYISRALPLEYYDWFIVYIVDRNCYLAETKVHVIWSFILFLIITGITLLVILSFSRSIVGSLNKIIKGMKTVRDGRISTLVNLQSRDELAFVEIAFNEMTSNVSQLIDQIQKQGADLYAMSEKQRRFELRALEAQINPHFIYNTLDCINWMAIEKDEDEISFMLKTLADIMRYSTSSIEATVKVQTEIDYLHQYLALQRVRFNNKFDYEIKIADQLIDFKIYKLLLQPFVENSVLHGLNGLDRKGKIEVGIEISKGDRVYFYIRDNGNGMDYSILQPILDHLDDDNSELGIGVKNAYNRLKIYFGDRFQDFQIRSEPDKGTDISFYINKE